MLLKHVSSVYFCGEGTLKILTQKYIVIELCYPCLAPLVTIWDLTKLINQSQSENVYAKHNWLRSYIIYYLRKKIKKKH